MKIKTQIIIQTVPWLAGMVTDYYLEGHVLAGGLIGICVGFALFLVLLYRKDSLTPHP